MVFMEYIFQIQKEGCKLLNCYYSGCCTIFFFNQMLLYISCNNDGTFVKVNTLNVLILFVLFNVFIHFILRVYRLLHLNVAV